MRGEAREELPGVASRVQPRRRRPFGEDSSIPSRGFRLPLTGSGELSQGHFTKNRGFIENLNVSKRKPLPLLPSRRGPRNGSRKGHSARLAGGPKRDSHPETALDRGRRSSRASRPAPGARSRRGSPQGPPGVASKVPPGFSGSPGRGPPERPIGGVGEISSRSASGVLGRVRGEAREELPGVASRVQPRRRRPFGEDSSIPSRGFRLPLTGSGELSQGHFTKNRGFIENLNVSKRKPLPLLPSRRGPRNGSRKGHSARLAGGPKRDSHPETALDRGRRSSRASRPAPGARSRRGSPQGPPGVASKVPPGFSGSPGRGPPERPIGGVGEISSRSASGVLGRVRGEAREELPGVASRVQPRRRRPFGEDSSIPSRGFRLPLTGSGELSQGHFTKNRGFIENLNVSKRKPLPLLPSRRGPRNGSRKGHSARLAGGPKRDSHPETALDRGRRSSRASRPAPGARSRRGSPQGPPGVASKVPPGFSGSPGRGPGKLSSRTGRAGCDVAPRRGSSGGSAEGPFIRGPAGPGAFPSEGHFGWVRGGWPGARRLFEGSARPFLRKTGDSLKI